MLIFLVGLEQQCFELDSQLQLLKEQRQQEESILQELSDAKIRAEADLSTSREQLRALESKFLM